jgi:hypothetical protein
MAAMVWLGESLRRESRQGDAAQRERQSFLNRAHSSCPLSFVEKMSSRDRVSLSSGAYSSVKRGDFVIKLGNDLTVFKIIAGMTFLIFVFMYFKLPELRYYFNYTINIKNTLRAQVICACRQVIVQLQQS